mmetsp:Transcript_36164/g.96061  ORF Transcript_36164/g.96061 Transcript_36164/m.96061 type:complete len:164 (-) Transcript_36164:238-729(-)|eukprot:CAMPEP_0194498546 /NCGR_PEP_ID=MMETSP0253-20130528/15146_1 /TAXON_ID=2966 /ORGANISM="Noctiluca scintillans" /LENGTH=163 /DNA_ID=CAMNT_0039340203 /DNA_START=41 /DNA_END=532 /DNA_ORIENTATION=-
MNETPREYEGLTDTQLATFKEAFGLFDKHQQSFLNWNEFPSLWRAIGQNPTEAELKEIQAETDEGTGHFSLDVFLKICESDNPCRLKDAVKEEQLIEAFKTFDKDGTGFITVAQLRYMLLCLGEKLDDHEADEFIEFADKDKTGEVEYERLVIDLMDRDPKNF